MPIAKKHNLKVIEDVSHAQGGMYKGKKVGTFGDVAAMLLKKREGLPLGGQPLFARECCSFHCLSYMAVSASAIGHRYA